MYTKTFDPLEVGNIRFAGGEGKTVPAISFECQAGNVLILALNFSDPVVRLILESLYLLGVAQVDETDFMSFVLEAVEYEHNPEELTKLLKRIRELRVERDDLAIKFDIDLEILKSIAVMLLERGNPSFSCGFKISEMVEVDNFNVITYEYLQKLYGETFINLYDRIVYNSDHLGFAGRYFYPEDCFIGRENLYLEAINAQSGGSYLSYTAVRDLYNSDEFFNNNRDFFHQTKCSCGGELVLRRNGYGHYTLLSCINPFCYEKMAFSLSDFTTAMGVDGLGATTLRDMTRSIALKNLGENGVSKVTYSDLLLQENALHLGSANAQRWYEFLDRVADYEGTLKDFIDLLGLPYVGTSAAKALTKAVLTDNEMTAPKLLKVCNSKGIHDTKNILNLWLYLPDMKFIVNELCTKINLEEAGEFKVCITRSVFLELDDGTEVKYTKEEFVRAVNRILTEKGVTSIRLVLSKSLTQDCRVLIAGNDRSSSKVVKAIEYGIPIRTAREFLENPGGA
jgi:hypothetical protein